MASSTQVVSSVADNKGEGENNVGIYGPVTRDLHSAWTKRVPLEQRLPEKCIRQLFNDLNVFPSKSQVFEMVHCARRKTAFSSHETGGDEGSFLTFGEFCIFATEFRRHYDQEDLKDSGSQQQQLSPKEIMTASHHFSSSSSNCGHHHHHQSNGGTKNQLRTQKSSTSAYDVFLGGSCNPTTWRREVAIPHFKSHGITFYNPQQSNWVPEMIELEHQAKQTSQILFFVLCDKTRNVVSMIETAFLAGQKRRLILIMDRYPAAGHKIGGDVISKAEWKDLECGLTVVHDLVERQGMPVFDKLDVALKCATKVVKENLSIRDLGLSDGAQPVKHAHLQVGDKLVRLREAFESLDSSRSGHISLDDLRMAFRIHVHRDLSQDDMKSIIKARPHLQKEGVDFDNFCGIVAEYKAVLRRNGPALDLGADAPSTGSRQRKTWKVRCLRPIVKPISKIFRRNSRQNAAAEDILRDCPASNVDSQRRGSCVRDVYLGGSTQSNWREEVAIPILKKNGLTFFHPHSSSSTSRMPLEAAAMDNSRVLLFVILKTSRSVGAMNEAAFHIGLRHNKVVLCVQHISGDVGVTEEDGTKAKLTKHALKDYNRGRSYLSDIANREGVPVFDNITEALHCVVKKCQRLT